MNSPWSVRTSCPQCAGEVDLDVGDRVLSCGYCRTRLYLVCRGPLRYYLTPAAERITSTPIVYLPFWRFRGIRYRVLGDPARIEGSVLDATVPAASASPAAATLGIRPQIAPLRLDRGEREAVSVDRPVADSVLAAETRVEALHGSKPLFTRLVGETVCVVLAPFTLERRGRDWRLREVFLDGSAHSLNAAQADAIRAAMGRPVQSARIDFLPLRCPECAQDLPAAHGAVALVCPHCTRAWWVRGNRFTRMPFASRPTARPGARYFPFWQIAFRVDGLPVSNRAELRRWAISYQPVPTGWERQPCQLLVPGFKVQAGLFARLGRIMSLAPLEIPEDGPPPSVRFDAEPVRLPLTEAAQALKVVLAQMAQSQNRAFSAVSEARLRVRRARLVYLPYHLQGSEWIEEETGTAIQATSVSHGAKI